MSSKGGVANPSVLRKSRDRRSDGRLTDATDGCESSSTRLSFFSMRRRDILAVELQQGFRKIWAALNIEVSRAEGGEARRERSSAGMQGQGETGGHRENPPTSCIVGYNSHVRKSGIDAARNRHLQIEQHWKDRYVHKILHLYVSKPEAAEIKRHKQPHHMRESHNDMTKTATTTQHLYFQSKLGGGGGGCLPFPLGQSGDRELLVPIPPSPSTGLSYVPATDFSTEQVRRQERTLPCCDDLLILKSFSRGGGWVVSRATWGRGGAVVRPLASHLGEPGVSIPGGATPGFPHAGIVRDDNDCGCTQCQDIICIVERTDGTTSGEALDVRVSVARIAPWLLDLDAGVHPIGGSRFDERLLAEGNGSLLQQECVVHPEAGSSREHLVCVVGGRLPRPVAAVRLAGPNIFLPRTHTHNARNFPRTATNARTTYAFRSKPSHLRFIILLRAPASIQLRALSHSALSLFRALSDELKLPESVLSDVIMTSSREREHERVLSGPIETRPERWVPAFPVLFSAFEAEKCGSYKVDTATPIKCAIASTRKAPNWRAAFSSHCVYSLLTTVNVIVTESSRKTRNEAGAWGGVAAAAILGVVTQKLHASSFPSKNLFTLTPASHPESRPYLTATQSTLSESCVLLSGVYPRCRKKRDTRRADTSSGHRRTSRRHGASIVHF
ncbi:hypothetical protein PR048_032623 [Dryococelus australis]|uniref:Uncharacterized protein n=1 Tax=Dryococelus australis TaxID=614101 RepID=A0ABQ9G3W1_9NEOP|nr:hypothetical protein PR048_032623 [Dryococelus australis]